MTDMVKYRGPDDSGYQAFDADGVRLANPAEGFKLFFGHRRLSIIDLSQAGHQPFVDDSGLWIVFNGEIFNYIELREELAGKGHTFRSSTDTEVILKVYREYREEGFSRLNGMWSFAIFDPVRKAVILSRDRFSIKPLFFTETEDAFYFGSEIKQLLPLVRKKAVNSGIMYTFLEQGISDHNRETFFEGIFRVEPKTNIVIDACAGRSGTGKYWDYEIEDIPDNEDGLDKFRELFLDSIRIRLRSDVQVGSLLSGGLDSSSITVFADRLQGGNFHSFSVVSRNRKYSEEKFIDSLSEKRGIRNTKLHLEPEGVLGSINEVLFHNDEPFGGLSVVAQYNILRKLREDSGIVVVLSGQGGDEVLMGYLKYFFFNLRELVDRGKVVAAMREIVVSLLKRTVIWQFDLKEARRYAPSLGRKHARPYLRKCGNVEPVSSFRDLTERQMLDIDKYSVPVLARYEDRNSMAHSLEIRLPFLDHRLVNFLLSMPTQSKLKGGWTKYILRQALDELPDDIRWRRDKRGFITPEELWLRTDLSSTIEGLFAGSALADLGYIDAGEFMRYYGNFRSNRGGILYSDIARVFIAELWARSFFS